MKEFILVALPWICIGIAVFAGMLHGTSLGVQILATSLLVAVPASFFISYTRPMAVLEKRLHMVGTVLCGWEGVKDLCGKAVFPISDLDLFPQGSTKLNGVKFYGQRNPDEVVSYTTSVIHAAGGGLVPVFDQLLKSRSGQLYGMEGGAGEIVLCGVELEAEAGAILLDCARGKPHPAGDVGAAVGRFTAIDQEMSGDVRWSTGSGLEFYLSGGSVLSGAVYAGEDAVGGGYCSLYIDESSRWIVTADSTLTNLNCAGQIVDDNGRSVSIIGPDGTVCVQGESAFSVTVERYSTECDMSAAGQCTQDMA